MNLTDRKRKAAEAHVQKMLAILGLNTQSHADLKDTPARYVRAMEELTSGLRTPARELPFTFRSFDNKRGKRKDKEYDQLIVIPEISFSSTCSHHLLPFFGKVWLGYLPAGGRVGGYSKFIRLVRHCAAQPQMQEEMVESIADEIDEILKPNAVIVAARAQHTCSMIRGVRDCSAKMVTCALRGKDALAVKSEFFMLCGLKGDTL